MRRARGKAERIDRIGEQSGKTVIAVMRVIYEHGDVIVVHGFDCGHHCWERLAINAERDSDFCNAHCMVG